jgi:hypothetical protein
MPLPAEVFGGHVETAFGDREKRRSHRRLCGLEGSCGSQDPARLALAARVMATTAGWASRFSIEIA